MDSDCFAFSLPASFPSPSAVGGQTVMCWCSLTGYCSGQGRIGSCQVTTNHLHFLGILILYFLYYVGGKSYVSEISWGVLATLGSLITSYLSNTFIRCGIFWLPVNICWCAVSCVSNISGRVFLNCAFYFILFLPCCSWILSPFILLTSGSVFCSSSVSS